MAHQKLEHRVFTRDDVGIRDGIFSDPQARLNWLRSIAEDAHEAADASVNMRDQHAHQARTRNPIADMRQPERQAMVANRERELVQNAAMLFAQVARMTDDGVFAEAVSRVLTDRDIDALKLALTAIESEREQVAV